MQKRFLAVPLLGLLQTLTAYGGAVTMDMDRLLSLSLEELLATEVTISTQSKQSLTKAPSVVSVIGAEDIKATGATNLREVLQSVPGIYVRSNSFTNRPQIIFRGATSTHTLLMVDGQPFKDLVWHSGIFWKGLPTAMIERIEIIRGPGSAVYGSDAAAGVINVITKAAAGVSRSEVGLRAGSFDTQEAWAQHGGNANGFAYNLTLDFSGTDGYNPFIPTDSQTSVDGNYGTDASYAPARARYGWDNRDLRFSVAKENWRLNAGYIGHRDVEVGLTGYLALDPRTQGDDNRLNLDLSYDNPKIAPNWGLNSQVSFRYLDYNSKNGFFERPPGYQDKDGVYPEGWLNRLRSKERSLGLDLSGVYDGFADHTLRLGAGIGRKDLYALEQQVNFGKGPDGQPLPAGGPLVDISDTPYAFAPEESREIAYLFAQDEWKIGADWALTAGVRYDHYSDFGAAVDPRVALVWRGSEQLTAKLMYGEAFRAPSYLELYSNRGATSGSADLDPERSNTWDLSFTYLPAKSLKLDLSLYRLEQSGLITTDASGQFGNRGRNHSLGLELEALWEAAEGVRLAGNFTVRDDSEPFLSSNTIPERSAYLRADWAFQPGWNWNLQANWYDDHPRPPKDTRNPIGAYTLLDTTLRYAPTPEWEFAASVRNLLDQDAREYSSRRLPENLPLPGRSLYAELRYKF